MNKKILLAGWITVLTGALTPVFSQWEQAPLMPETPADNPTLQSPVIMPFSLETQGTLVTTNETEMTAELRSLAHAFQYDPVRIFEYVKNKIDYLPTYGIYVGAHGCYLAGRGSEWDQNALLIALLRESGYACRYGYAKLRYNRNDLLDWLPVSASQMVGYFTRFGGYAGDISGISSQLYVYRVWTEVSIGGAWHQLDPAIKTYRSSSINLKTAMAYNETSFRDIALSGATVGNTDVGNLNRDNIRSTLSSYTTNLIAYLKAHAHDAHISDVFGVRKIVPENVETLPQQLPFVVDVDISTLQYWDHVQSPDYATYQVQHGSINYPFKGYEIAGKSLILSYTNNCPVLKLNNIQVAIGNSLSAGSHNLVLNVHAPVHSSWTTLWLDQQRTLSVSVGGIYSLVHDFDDAGVNNLKNSIEQLNKAIATGTTGEQNAAVLELMNNGYNYQRGKNLRLMSAVWNQPIQRISNFGIIGYAGSMSVDLPGGLISTYPYGSPAFETQTLIGSALEHGVLEQFQQEKGISTIGALDLNIAEGNRTFFATTATWSYVKTQINSKYPSSLISTIESGILQGNSYILPEIGSIVYSNWTGVGYIQISSAGAVNMRISDNLKGAFGALGSMLSGWWGSILSWFGFGGDGSVNETFGADPVSMVTGAYWMQKTDLSLGGSGGGISFERYYRSDENFKQGVLGFGWNHSFQGRIRETTRTDIGWGERAPEDVAAQIVQNVVLVDLMSGNRDVVDWATAAVVTRWAMDQATRNTVTVELGQKSLDFVRQPDGKYTSPPGVTDWLMQTNNVYHLMSRDGTKYQFNANGMLNTVVDVDGGTTDFTYNAQTNLQSIADSYGRTMTFTYNIRTNLQTVTDSTGRQISYGYDAFGNLTSFTDAENNTWIYQYNTNHQIIAVIDPENITMIQNQYDPTGCVTQQIGAGSGIWNFYIGGGQGTEEDPFGGQITHWFDDAGRNLGTQNALGYRTRNIYDGQGRLMAYVDAMGVTNQYVYDAHHNLLSKTEAVGTLQERITKYHYDSLHRPIIVTNALGHATQYSYDEKHHVLSISNAAYNLEYGYYSNGLLQTQTDGNGYSTEYFYDNYGNVRLINLPDGSTISNLWSIRGDLLTTWDALENKTENSYDANRQLISTTDPRSNTMYKTWYDNGLLETEVDVGGRTNRYTYTPAYKVSTVIEPDGSIVSNLYDTADRLTAVVTPEGRVTYYELDAIGQSTNIQYPATSIGRNFNANGRITETKNAKGEITHYDYDALNRITNVVHSGQWQATFGYDFLGNRTQSVNQQTETFFAYDAMNRLTNSILNAGGLEFRVSNSYDSSGNRTNVVYPGSFSVPFLYDENNRLTSVDLSNFGLSEIEFFYDSANRMTNVVYPNGVIGDFSYNQNGQIIEYCYQSGTNKFLHRILQRNALGFKTIEDVCVGLSPQLSGQIRRDRFNNAADQLISLQSSAGTDNFLYGVNGNLKERNGHGGQFSYQWDYANRLSQVSSSTSQVSYLYDASGVRIGRIADDGASIMTNYFVIDYKAPLKMPLAETDATGRIVRYYIWSTHGLLAHLDVTDNGSQITVDSISYYHIDEQGSTLALTAENGNVTDQYAYSPNGNILFHSGTNSTPYQWLGAIAVRNEGNDLYYMLNRYYSADMKQFISIDPKGVAGGYNLYAYANLNPLFLSDPFGLEAGSGWLSGIGNAISDIAGKIWDTSVYVAGKAWDISLDIVGKTWTSPNTAIGLLWGGIGYAVGLLPGVNMPTISFENNAIQFKNHPLMFGAITFGNSISYASDFGPDSFSAAYGRWTQTGLHEMGHTYQYQLLGPLFLPIYLFSGGVSAGNPFEQAADDFALGGSWMP
ncbi:MAG: DUF6531 domain-containing protein [Kiritimatiellales bacterium]